MANEKQLISLDEALKATHSEIYWTESQQAAVRSFLVKQPRVDAVEVVHARWIRRIVDHEKPGYFKEECSICGFDGDAYAFLYCPNCGAKMDGGNEDGG